jgi:hypothetical protein
MSPLFLGQRVQRPVPLRDRCRGMQGLRHMPEELSGRCNYWPEESPPRYKPGQEHFMRNMLGQMSLHRNPEGIEGDNQVPTVTIDGKKVRIKKNATVLDAAKKAGIWIPTLCYHPSLTSEVTCRLCMVELDRGEWKQLITACNYPVSRDITVYAYSEAAKRARCGVIELLLARAPEMKN